MSKNIEAKVLVGVAMPLGPQEVPTVVLGMTPAAWEAITGGRTHDFDLTKIGIPVKLLVFRGETHEELATVMRTGAEASGAEFNDRRNTDLTDLSITPPSKH